MRTLILATIVALSFAHISHAQTVPNFSKAPTEEFLSQLDTEQLEILRTALRSCGQLGARRVDRNPCVISRTDEAVNQAGDPDLQAFHQRLVPRDRYDSTRSSVVWRNWATGN